MKMHRRLSLWATPLLTSTHISKSFLASRASTIITVEPSHQDGSMCLRNRMSLRAVCAKQSPVEWGRFVCGSRRAFDPPLSAKPRFIEAVTESLPDALQPSHPQLRGLLPYLPRCLRRLR